ncbi:MAG: 50S ribosomal protein L13 [Candidatus Micrarchaeia archaeon]
MERIKADDYKVIDAKNAIAGRLASKAAKMALNGEKVAIVNAESAIISGKKSGIIENYKTRVNLKNKVDPDNSPYWPRRPDLLLKRIIRGMLPYRKPHGKRAYDNLRVFIGVPEAFKGAKMIEVAEKNPKEIYVGYMTIGELSKRLGYDKF